MPRGDKSAYSSKQKRRARHIEQSYERRGVSSDEAARRAWATVNEREGGGQRGGSASRGRSTRRRKTVGRSRSSLTSRGRAARSVGRARARSR